MRNCKHIVYVQDHSSHCVNWRLCAVLAPSLQYNARWMVDIYAIAAQIRSVEYWSLNMRNTISIVYVRDHSSCCVNGRLCAVVAPSLQYNARWIVDIGPTAAEIRSVEYWSLIMRSCKYIAYVRDHSSNSVKWRMCPVFGTLFAV
jgi:hypothetical protein